MARPVGSGTVDPMKQALQAVDRAVSRLARMVSLAFLILVGTVVAFVAIFIVGSEIEGFLGDRAEGAARTAEPVGVATFGEVFDSPSGYAGKVWELEGIVSSPEYWSRPRRWRSTVLSECIAPCSSFAPGRTLYLLFDDDPPPAYSDGDTVRVICRVVGIKKLSFGYVDIVADVCRDLTVIGGDA